MLQRTPGKWVLYNVATGTAIERWPVDAREILAGGEYTLANPNASEAAAEPLHPPADPVPHVTAANALNALESPTGAPLQISPAAGVGMAAPMQLPARTTAKRR